MTDDPFDLDRFVQAQAGTHEQALGELTAGKKRTHWMWFIFPQLRELGRSSTARFYGIGSLDEARAFLAHPLLGSRLLLCTRAVLACDARSLGDLFGSPDDVKFRSCMTLFEAAAGDAETLFGRALERWCSGARDNRTLELIAGAE